MEFGITKHKDILLKKTLLGKVSQEEEEMSKNKKLKFVNCFFIILLLSFHFSHFEKVPFSV